MEKPLTFVIVDYGMGNLKSVENAFRFLGCETVVTNAARDLASADAIVLPGVGAFGQAMHNLKHLSIIDPLNEQIIHNRKPFLGICLGMQLVALDSEEGGSHAGLGWIPGHVRKLPVPDNYRLPHIGWNDVVVRTSEPLFHDMTGDLNFFFVHTFHIECEAPYVAAVSQYGCEVTSAIQKDNIFAVQFHPEKSQRNGLKLLRNFVNHAAQITDKEYVQC